ncbi:MAG: Rho termination factor N-terminal domain-containing protein, partial [Lachnospiraceae bacterium]|nr:Rho termination factor N-terminal domain-containing protein [Lachnospiraceae bacterium]
MREKLESLPLSEIREIAKGMGIKRVSTVRKGQLIEMILEISESAGKADESLKSDKAEKQEEQDKPVKHDKMSGSDNKSDKNAGDGHIIREGERESGLSPERTEQLDSGIVADGILEVMPDGYGFIRCENFLPGDDDVYVAPSQIRRFNLKTGDILHGKVRIKTQNEKFGALLYLDAINGLEPSDSIRRKSFENLTPIFPNKRLFMETGRNNVAMRMLDLVSPIGKGQRGMIVSQPKAGKTTLLKEVARAIQIN